VEIAIPIFDGLTALDAVGPYEVLSRLPGSRVEFAAFEPGVKRTDNGMLALTADRALDDLPHPEVIVMPGGHDTRALMHDERMLAWVRAAHATSRFTTSVCTGSLVLGAAGMSSGIDMALTLAARIAGEDVARAIQLAIEYDPEPPFDSGSIAKASPEVLELARRRA
jgi:putative intracellular protease/amidase